MGCSVLGRGAEPLVRTQFLEHPPTRPHHALERCIPQIMELVGVVLVVVGSPIVAIQCAAGPKILGPADNGGVLIENGCLL